MFATRLLAMFSVFAWLSILAPLATAAKTPNLGKTKFKDVAKFLALTPEQQLKVRPDVDRIQAIVKDAEKQRGQGGWGRGGRRIPVGGSGVMGRGGVGGSDTAPPAGNFEEMRRQRQEWQKEIDNRVDEIKSFLTPQQLEKFKSIELPNLNALPSRGPWQ